MAKYRRDIFQKFVAFVTQIMEMGFDVCVRRTFRSIKRKDVPSDSFHSVKISWHNRVYQLSFFSFTLHDVHLVAQHVNQYNCEILRHLPDTDICPTTEISFSDKRQCQTRILRKRIFVRKSVTIIFKIMLETMVYNVWVTGCSTGCRTNARVGQMSVSDKCPCRANVRVGKMSVSEKCPSRTNVRVGQMSLLDTVCDRKSGSGSGSGRSGRIFQIRFRPNTDRIDRI